jgi:hypothetical protein
LEVGELRDNLFESNKIFEALWPAFGNQDKSVLSQFKNLLGLVAEQIADQNVPSATSPLMLTFKSAYNRIMEDSYDTLDPGAQSALDGISGVADAYIESPETIGRGLGKTTDSTNGYVVASQENRDGAIDLLDSIITTVDLEIDKSELDDEAISFLDMVIRPLLVRLRELISSHYGDDEGVEEAKVESSTTIGNLRRLTDFGRATKSKIGGASGALVRIAAVGDALEKIGKYLV